MSKQQETSRADWEEATNELRKEFDKRLREMDRQMRRGFEQDQQEIEQGMNAINLRENLEVARGKVIGALQRGDDFVSEHPLVVVGAALAAGIVIGALLSTNRRSRQG